MTLSRSSVTKSSYSYSDYRMSIYSQFIPGIGEHQLGIIIEQKNPHNKRTKFILTKTAEDYADIDRVAEVNKRTCGTNSEIESIMGDTGSFSYISYSGENIHTGKASTSVVKILSDENFFYKVHLNLTSPSFSVSSIPEEIEKIIGDDLKYIQNIKFSGDPS